MLQPVGKTHLMGRTNGHFLSYGLSSFVVAVFLAQFLTGCSQDKTRPLRIGEIVAPFSAQTIDSETFALNEFAGRPMLMRFFLTDCSYCKADTPIFNSFYATYKDSGLMVVYLNTNAADIEEAEAFRRELDVRFPMIYDKGAVIAKQYKVEFMPLTLVLSPEHRLLAALAGGVSREELDELLGPCLKKPEAQGNIP